MQNVSLRSEKIALKNRPKRFTYEATLMDPFEPRLILLLVKKKKKRERRKKVGGVWLIWPFERQLHGGGRFFFSVDVDGLHPRRSNEK